MPGFGLLCTLLPRHLVPRSGVLRTQKLKTHLLRTKSLFKPGAGPYIAMRATPTARDFLPGMRITVTLVPSVAVARKKDAISNRL